MPADGLEPIRSGLNTFASVAQDELPDHLAAISRQVEAIWLGVLYSDAPDHTLHRYFTDQFRELAMLSPDQRDHQTSILLHLVLPLLLQLNRQYAAYLDPQLPASVALTRELVRPQLPKLQQVKRRLLAAAPEQTLPEVVLAYFEEMPPEKHEGYTLQALWYLEELIKGLDSIPEPLTDTILSEALVRLQFNDLSFLRYWQCEINEQAQRLENDFQKAGWLRTQLEQFRYVATTGRFRRNPLWPPLQDMVTAWLKEILAGMVDSQSLSSFNADTEKLTLNLSVAHLACLLWVLWEEGLIRMTSLKEVFDFCARHISTKKQSIISSRGLSKEYYSTSQATALYLKRFFDRASAHLKQQYFPLWAGVSVIAAALLSSR